MTGPVSQPGAAVHGLESDQILHHDWHHVVSWESLMNDDVLDLLTRVIELPEEELQAVGHIKGT